jgi:acetyl-CoA synthetase
MPWRVTDQIEETASYDEAMAEFTWDIPDDYNIAADLLRKHEDPRASVALFEARPDERRRTYTFHDLDRRSNELANAFETLGIEATDRVAIVAPQIPETALTYLACWKTGAVCVPISTLYGFDGLEYRLRDSGAETVIVHEDSLDTVETVLEAGAVSPEVFVVGEHPDVPYSTVADLTAREPSGYSIDVADRSAPAMIQYTSGTTGQPKGTVLSHEVVPGWATGFYMMFDRRLPDRSIVWAPADWAWVTGPFFFGSAWHYGRPIVGYPMGPFDPVEAFELMAEFGVTLGLFPPTALRMMRSVERPAERYDLALEVICGSGEPITSDIYRWVEETFDDVLLTEAYGQTEADPSIADCPSWFDVKPGSMGRPILGREATLLDPDTREEVGDGEIGELALKHADDPSIFQEYWNKPERTAASFVGEWYLTGDLAERDADGYYWYKGRADDVIITSGYRVGPDEVEDAVLKHDAVAEVGVIGVPDDTRGEIIKAFVATVDDVTPSEALAREIKDLVKSDLAKYEYPREIEFVESLPMTTTDKIRRVDLRKREGIAEE